jgi:hypothetical protein
MQRKKIIDSQNELTRAALHAIQKGFGKGEIQSLAKVPARSLFFTGTAVISYELIGKADICAEPAEALTALFGAPGRLRTAW